MLHNQLNSTAGQGNKIPDVYTPSLIAKNEAMAMEAFNNFVNSSQLAQESNEDGKIALYLDYVKMQKNKKN